MTRCLGTEVTKEGVKEGRAGQANCYVLKRRVLSYICKTDDSKACFCHDLLRRHSKRSTNSKRLVAIRNNYNKSTTKSNMNYRWGEVDNRRDNRILCF